jgi:hypothetical protein
LVHHLHHIGFYNVPTFFEKGPGQTIRTGHLRGILFHFFGYRLPKLMQGWVLEMELILIEILLPRPLTTDHRLEVVMDCTLSFSTIIGARPLIVFEAVDVIFILLLTLALRWKNFVSASASFIC